jgi:hypothetical protein
MIPVLDAAGVTDPHTMSRALIAVMRREDPAAPGVRATGPMEQGARTFAPGDTIPYDVLTVYDLDGDVWDRWTDDPADGMRDSWRMRDYDPDEQDPAAAGVYVTGHLLTESGPLTHLDVPWQGGPRPEDR